MLSKYTIAQHSRTSQCQSITLSLDKFRRLDGSFANDNAVTIVLLLLALILFPDRNIGQPRNGVSYEIADIGA